MKGRKTHQITPSEASDFYFSNLSKRRHERGSVLGEIADGLGDLTGFAGSG